jgi:predicted NAD-dependent protein-ADP-ribosyltransferase YbiA (DUF1768 family)
MAEEIKPVNQPGVIAPIVPDYHSEGVPSDRSIDPYALMEKRMANIGKANTFTNISPYELPGTGRYQKIFPGEDMEELYAQGQTWSSKMVNSLGKGLALTGTTLLQSTVGLANGVYQSLSDERAASFYDNEFNRSLDEFNKGLENSLPNYYTKRERDADWYSPDKLFSANFLWDGIVKNMGFAAGAALSGGVYASGLKLLNSIPQVAKLFSVRKAGDVLAATEEALLGANKAGDAYGKIKSLSDAYLGTYRGLDVGQRALVAGLATTGEAGFEAYHNLNDFRNKKIEEYKAANGGVAPTGVELAKINAAADSVGNSSFLFNTALLTATNYIQFPKILGSSTRVEKGIINSTIKEIESTTVDAAGKLIAKPKNIFQRAAPLVFSPSEAFEEGAQYAISIGTQDYYNKKYKGDDGNFMESLNEAVAETIGTNEGMENVLIGGLSGAIMQARGTITEGIQKRADTAAAITDINKTTLSDFTKDTSDSVRRGVALQEEREQQLQQGNIANVKDLDADYIINYLTPRIKYGRFDLVRSDIEDYRALASTEEGFAQLIADGKALAGDTREAYLRRLDGFEATAENVKSLYQSLNLRYGNIVDKDNKLVYNSEVMDKMIYAASKVADYDNRIPQLLSKLAGLGVVSADVVRDDKTFNEALEDIKALKIIEDDQLDLERDLRDLKDLTERRDKFLKEYSEIKKAPQNYTTREKAPVDMSGVKQTISVKTKDAGDEELEVGVEYYAGAKEIEVEEGGTIQKFLKFTLLGETEDGSKIIVQTADGKITKLPKSALEQYKIGKVADTDKRENAKFFIETTDHIFTYNLGKGNKKPGRLSYDPKTDKLTFISLDGKFVRQVTRDQFEAQEGYTVGQIYSNKKFTKKADAARTAAVAKEEKLATRNKIIVDLYNESKKRLDEVNATLEKNKNKLSSIEEALENVTKTAAGLPRKRLTKAITKTINELSKIRQDIETQNNELQAEKEELEATLPYFQDFASNVSEFEGTGSEVLKQLKDDVDTLEEMISHTDDAIKQGNSLITAIDSALQTALSVFNDFVRRVREENPDIPFLLSEFQDKLERYMGEEGAKQFIAERLGFTELVLELEQSITGFSEELKIPGMENKLQKLQDQVKELSTGLDDLINEQIAKAKVLEAFEQYAENYKKQQEEEKKLLKNRALQQELLGTNGTGVQNVIDTKAFQAAAKKAWKSVVGGTIPIDDGKEHQARANRFGFRLPSMSNVDSIRGMIVTSKTEEQIIPGLTKHLYAKSPEDVIALVMVQLNDDGTYTVVDEFGNPLPAGADLVNSAVYQVFPSSKLTATYDGKVETMFRSSDKDIEASLREQYAAWRTARLNEETLGDPQTVEASFGVPEYFTYKDANGNEVKDYSVRTSVQDAGFVTNDELENNPVLKIATTNESITQGSVTFNTPLGRVFLKLPNGLVKLYNRQFNDKEANTIFEVIKQLSKNAIDDKTIKKDRSYLLMEWLKSTVYWGIAKNLQTGERKDPGFNNIWFEDVVEDGKPVTKLFISGKGANFNFTPTELENNKDTILALLKGMYNNTNATLLNDKAFNDDYFEITGLNEDGSPIVKQWPNYQSYLLSSEGRTSEEIPLATPLKPMPKDTDGINRKDIYFTLTSTPDDFILPTVKPVVTSTPTPAATPTEAATQPQPTRSTPGVYVLDGQTVNTLVLPRDLGQVTFVVDGKKYDAANGTVPINDMEIDEQTAKNLLEMYKTEDEVKRRVGATIIVAIKPQLETTTIPNEATPEDVTAEDLDEWNDAPVNPPSDDVYRLQLVKEIKSFQGENWNKVESWLKANLPNIPVYRVKNVIQATNGRQAWGMFRDGAIYIYENAEVGTAYHEIFHAVMTMFTESGERNAIYDEFKKRKGTFEDADGNTVSYSDATYKQAEEALAEEFRDYVLTGKIPSKPENGRPFILKMFADLVSFIKEMFVGPKAPSNTEKLFGRIGNGYYKTVIPFESNLSYAKQGIIDIEDAEATSTSVFSIAKIPATQVHEIMEQMTYSTLADLSKTNQSLFSVPELNKKELYNRLKSEVLNLIRWKGSMIEDALAKKEITAKEAALSKSNLIILHKNVDAEWDSIIKKHQEYLKTYSVEFDENDQAILTDEDASGKSDWQDARKMDNFKKASSAIKLLIGTLPVMEITEDGTRPKRSSMGGVVLMPSDKVFITLMNNLHTSVNIDDMINRLRQLATNNPSYEALYKRITKRPSSAAGYDFDQLKNTYDLQLATSFWKTFKRQNADVKIVFTLPTGDVVIGDSSLASAASQARSEMSSDIVSALRTSDTYVKYDTVNKEYTSQAAIKNIKLISNELSTYTSFLEKVGITFTPKELRKKLSPNQLATFREATEGVLESLSSLEGVKALTTKSLDIDGQLLRLGSIKAILENPEFESTYFNLNGERTQTYIGTNLMSDMYDIISNIKNYNDLGDTKYKYLTTDVFALGSATMNKIFNPKNNARRANTSDIMKTGYVDGSVNEQTNKKKESSKLTAKERLIQEINLNLEGYYMNLVPGDASIEWMVKLGTFVSQKELMNTGMKAANDIFKEYFMSELNLSRETDRPIVQDENKTRKSTDLRFFKGILPADVHNSIVAEVKAGKTNEAIYNKYESKINSALEKLVNEQAEDSEQMLRQYGAIQFTEEGIDASGLAFANNEIIDQDVLTRQLKGLAINYMIANIELHKLVYSDPYQYKDELKRIKNFNSPRQPLVANSPEMNKAIDRVYNEGFDKTDIVGSTNFIRDFFRTITLADVLTTGNLPGYGRGEKEKPFEETDGGGYISMKANRNFRIRASNWNAAEESQYRHDVGYEKLFKSGASDEELKKYNRKNPGVMSAYTPLKPIVSGNKADGQNYNDAVLDKFALFPLSFRTLHELNPNSDAIKLYDKMQKEDIDYAVYGTGRKVGAGEKFELYKDGKFNTDVVSPTDIVNIPFDIMGVQAEVPSKENAAVTQGSQITKLVTMDFMQAGMPVDFEPGKDFEKRYVKWNALKDKASYNDGNNLYKEIQRNQLLLEWKIKHGYEMLLNKLGITETDKGFEITRDNVDKMINTLSDEILKREVNDNITAAFAGFKKGDVVLEATPAFQQIRNILYSIADKNVVSPKLNGGMKVQTPSTLLGDSVKQEEVNGKTTYTSNNLKFYVNKDGERVCEIMVGRWFSSDKSDEELLEFFNSEEGQEILKGVAFRIPTQKQNSIDVFKIAKFLPKELGDSVVIPSELVRKAGSDFDIDKLSIYLKNVYDDGKGNIRLVPFYDLDKTAKTKFGEIFDEIIKDKKEFAEANITKYGGLQQLLGDVILGTASDKQMAKWVPIFKNMFGEDMAATDVEEALMIRLEKAGKNLSKLTNADWVAASREEFIEKMYGKSLENAYVKSLENLISSPYNFDALIKPNSADQMKDIAKDINKKLGKPEIDYSSTANMLSRRFMTGLRQAFVSGKYAIGIAAVNQTNHAQNQRTLMYVNTDNLENGVVNAEDRFWLKSNDGKILLPHNSVVVNGKKYPTLSMIKNTADETISDIIGQFIDGYVDISKGPWIMELGATPNVASTWMFLAKVGVPIQTIAYFMNQPIVRDYLGSLENNGYSWLFIDSLMDGTMDKYAPQGDVVATELPTETALGKMVGVDVDNLTDPQKAQQQLVLQEFLKYAKMANHLFQVTQGTNYDTATLNDPSLIFKKGKQLESARRTIFSSINDEGNVIPGVDAILNSSFVGYLKETMTDIRDAFAEILTSDKPAVRDVIEEALTPFVQLNDRDFVKLARKTVNDLFDWAVQTDTGVNRRITSILLGNDTTKSAATLIMDYKNMVLADKTHPLFDNLIINSIQKKPGRKEEGAPDNIFLVGKDAKVYNQNQIIYAFRELKRNVPTELYGKLVRLAVLQSGLNNSPISITSLLPYEDFTAVYNETLSKIDKMPNLNNFNKLNVLQRNNWADTDIVPSKKAAWKKSKKGNWFSRPYSPSEINFVDKRLALATQKGLIPQTLNISVLSREGNSKFITFVWEKGNFTKEQKATMRKKSDYSYINKGLFKRVEDGFGNPIQLTTEDKSGKTYTSYVYKAINAWGDSFRANELYDTEDPANPLVTTGQKSVLDNGYIQVKEVEDSVILNLLPEINPTPGLITDSFEDYSIQPAIDGSNKINIYAGTGENAELSNFAKRPFKDELDPPFSDVNKFDSVEQAFQFYKVYYTVPKNQMFKGGDVTRNNYAIAKQILRTTDGATLRRLGKSFENFDSSEWDNDASNVMYSFIKKSFEQNPEALQKLLATGNAELTHTQDKGKWGKEFPRLLMGVRSELSATKDVNKIAPEGLPEIDNNNKNNCG